MTHIIVNGKPRDVANDLIGYCGACHLADRPVAKGPYTVTWSTRDRNGSIAPGDTIPVEHGLVLNVSYTSNA